MTPEEFKNMTLKMDRSALATFIREAQLSAPPYIGVTIPSAEDLRHDSGWAEGHEMSIEDKTVIAAILALAIPAARKRIAEIEEYLTKAGEKFNAI